MSISLALEKMGLIIVVITSMFFVIVLSWGILDRAIEVIISLLEKLESRKSRDG